MSLFLQMLLFLLIGYLFCLLFMYLRQESFIFFPPTSTHDGHGYENVIDYRLEQKTATLRGWLVNPELVREKLLIYYGVNAEDIFHNIDLQSLSSLPGHSKVQEANKHSKQAIEHGLSMISKDKASINKASI